MISQLNDLSLTPDVICAVTVRDAVNRILLDRYLCNLKKLVLRLLSELVKMADPFVGLGELVVGLNSKS